MASPLTPFEQYNVTRSAITRLWRSVEHRVANDNAMSFDRERQTTSWINTIHDMFPDIPVPAGPTDLGGCAVFTIYARLVFAKLDKPNP